MRHKNTGGQIPDKITSVRFSWGRRSRMGRSQDNCPSAAQNDAQIYALPESSAKPHVVGQPRPVRCESTPTGPFSGSQRSSPSIGHTTLVIGGRDSKEGVLTCELLRTHATNIHHLTTPVHVSTAIEELCKAPIIGYTRMTNLEISERADALIRRFGTYDLFRRNCRHFSNALLQDIIDATIVEPDAHAHYRFRRENLRFMGTFHHSGIQPGWILPTPATILVNVGPTDVEDTWRGQVQDSEEYGMFLRSTVERI